MDSIPVEICALIIGFCYGLDLTSLRLVCSLFNGVVLNTMTVRPPSSKKIYFNTNIEELTSCKSTDRLKRLRWICRSFIKYRFVFVESCVYKEEGDIERIIETNLNTRLCHTLYTLDTNEHIFMTPKGCNVAYLRKHNIKAVYEFKPTICHYRDMCKWLSGDKTVYMYWFEISKHPNITWEIIRDNPNLPWNWN